VSDLLALVAILQTQEIERRLDQWAQAINAVGEVVHQLALLAAELDVFRQGRAFDAVACRCLGGREPNIVGEDSDHRFERSLSVSGAAASGRS